METIYFTVKPKHSRKPYRRRLRICVWIFMSVFESFLILGPEGKGEACTPGIIVTIHDEYESECGWPFVSQV